MMYSQCKFYFMIQSQSIKLYCLVILV